MTSVCICVCAYSKSSDYVVPEVPWEYDHPIERTNIHFIISIKSYESCGLCTIINTVINQKPVEDYGRICALYCSVHLKSTSLLIHPSNNLITCIIITGVKVSSQLRRNIYHCSRGFIIPVHNTCFFYFQITNKLYTAMTSRLTTERHERTIPTRTRR